MYVLHGTKINETLSNYYENISEILHACKMVELYTIIIVTLFEYTLMFDLTGWRIPYRNKRINETIRQNIFHILV